MKKIKLVGSLVVLSVLLVGCGAENNEGTTVDKGNTQTEGTSAIGENVYNERCASCHGVDLKGMGQDLTTVKDRLSKEDMMEINKNGLGVMPGGQVNDEENEAVTDWLLNR